MCGGSATESGAPPVLREAGKRLFVDDGSLDRTAEYVRQLRLQDFAVLLIRFGRNFCHQAALFAGVQAAHGAAVITMDCDLQHPPERLPRMLEAWRGGARVVQMVRMQTDDAGCFKRISSANKPE